MKTFNKYACYEDAVQNPEADIELFQENFRALRGGREPYSFREDFCASGFLSAEWAKLSPKHTALGLDIDTEVLAYAEQTHRQTLSPRDQKRLEYKNCNVLKSGGMKADIVAALNFSYWVFLTRNDLLKYFKAVRASMKRHSVFFLDTSGGSEAFLEGEEIRECDGFKYYWECEYFSPVTHECTFSIHFKFPRQPKQMRQFVYHWRYWSIPELKEVLTEAGFRQVIVYWEGDDGEGGGSGEFTPTQEGENCLSWVAYLAALP